MRTPNVEPIWDRAVLLADLEDILADPRAAARRALVLEEDPRTDAEVDALFVALDEVVALARARSAVVATADTRRADLPAVAPPPTTDVPPDGVIEQGDDELGRAAEVLTEEPAEITEDAPTAPLERPRKARRGRVTELDARRSRAVELLYDDVLWLFSINDFEAALISLERLLVVSTLGGEVEEFISLNDAKLMKLYEGYVGPFTRVPTHASSVEGEGMPADYLAHERLAHVFELVDGQRQIEDIITLAPFLPVQTCAALSQLNRARMIELPP